MRIFLKEIDARLIAQNDIYHVKLKLWERYIFIYLKYRIVIAFHEYFCEWNDCSEYHDENSIQPGQDQKEAVPVQEKHCSISST